jgi:hypothetical protein
MKAIYRANNGHIFVGHYDFRTDVLVKEKLGPVIVKTYFRDDCRLCYLFPEPYKKPVLSKIDALLADFAQYIEDWDARYRQEQETGDAVSVASTRASFCAGRDLLWILERHLSRDEITESE